MNSDPPFDKLEQELTAIPTSELSPESRQRIASQVQRHALELGKPSWYTQALSGRYIYGGALVAATLVVVVLFIITAPSSSIQLSPIGTPGQILTLSPGTPGTTSLMIEGPVSAIDANIVTIYGITVSIPEEEDAVLSHVEIGDTLYIEGIANPNTDDAAKFIATRVEQLSR